MQSTGLTSLNCSERTQTSHKVSSASKETAFTSIVRQNFVKNRITRWENNTHLCSFLPVFLQELYLIFSLLSICFHSKGQYWDEYYSKY